MDRPARQELPPGIVEEIEPIMKDGAAITTDAGYHSEANLVTLERKQIDGFIAVPGYRQRDPRYQGQEKHTARDVALWAKRPKESKPTRFNPSEFQVAADFRHCLCAAGKR